MTTIILTRHGYVEGIEPRRFRGRQDIPLSELGKLQAEATARRIAAAWRPTIVYTSPMARCIETGVPIARACQVPHKVLNELNDLDYGAWQWQTHADIKQVQPDAYATWHETPHLFRFPDGESLQDLVARTGNAWRFVLARHRDETIVLVGHDSVNRALVLQLLDQPLSSYWRILFEPCGVSEIEFFGHVPQVRRINETYHLSHL